MLLERLLNIAQYPQAFAFCVLLAFIPVIAWFLVLGFHPKRRWKYVILTFIAGMFSAAIILTYQYFWGTQFNFIFFLVEPQNFDSAIRASLTGVMIQSFFVLLSVGFLEEYAKHWVVKKTDRGIFESIDDVIEFSIIAALGFAFLENIGYFLNTLLGDHPEELKSLFVIRSVFVVFVHILCSGIYGYFYGLGHFATPVLQEYEKENRLPFFPRFFHHIAHLKKVTVFREEMATVGLVVAMMMHGMYNFLLEMDTIGRFASLIVGDEISFFGSGLKLHLFMLPMILVIGFAYLSHLLHKKELQKRYGHLEVQEVFVAESAVGSR